MTPQQNLFLMAMYSAATRANHKWPKAAACEAAVETGWGAHIPKGSNNVLGIKAYRGWSGPTVTANGTEQLASGKYTGPQSDLWCVFEDTTACFAEQMLILKEPRYAAAMESPTVEAYIIAECAIWSTGHEKGALVLQIYNQHKDEIR